MNRMVVRIGRWIALAALIQILIATGALAEAVREVKLPNGLTVLLKESHAAPVFTAQIWFRVGSRNEHTGITGISHMLEHMLFGSSKHYKKGEISKLVHERGGIDNAATWTDFTYYWELLSSENLEFALKTLAEKVGSALLLDAEFAKERTVVLSELEGNENDPDRLLYEGLMATAFVASAYQWPTIGWRSDVRNIDRAQLAGYYHAYYHPNNATLVLVGDFDSDKALALAKKYLGALPSARLPRPPYTAEPPQRGQRRVQIRREGSTERVMMGYHVPSLRDPDTFPLMVLDQVLSGGRASRLYQALVETGMATGAWSSAGAREDPALFMLGATARQGVKADQLEKTLLEQVEKARADLPSEEEMRAAVNQLEAYYVYQNDSVSDQGEQLGYYNTLATWRYLEQLIPKIKAVTAEQVRDAARKYLTADNLTVGTFIPTAPASGGMTRPPSGTLHATPGVCYYRAESRKSKVESPALRNPHSVKPYRILLDNGMVVIVQENHSNPTVAIAGSIKAGRCFDPAGKTGVAGLTARMLGRGTAKRTSLQLAREAEFVGAQLDASADVESASFTAKSLTKDFALVLDLLSDELRNASFPADQFEKARGETLSALAQSKESPDAQASRAFYNAVFPAGHAYHRLTVEDAQKSIQGITRDDLVSFHAAYYRPDTTIIVIAGDVDSKQAVELVGKYFGDWKAAATPGAIPPGIIPGGMPPAGPAPKVEIPTVQPPKQGTQVVIPMPDKSEVDVYFGWPMGMKRSDADYYAMRIANQILGGSGALLSVLGEDIRERNGLVYDVYSTFDAGLGAGPWYAALGASPANVDKAIDLLRKDVARFAQTGATREQFERAREFVIGVFPIALETNQGVARMLLSAEFYGLGMDYLANYAKIYRAVTLAQVNAAARRYLKPESATLVIAGPYENKK